MSISDIVYAGAGLRPGLWTGSVAGTSWRVAARPRRLRLKSRNAARPRRARPPTTPTTIPAMAPPDRPDDLETTGVEVEELELVAEALVALDVWLVVVDEGVVVEDVVALLVVAELAPSCIITCGLEIWLAELSV